MPTTEFSLTPDLQTVHLFLVRKLARRYLALPVTTAPAHRAFDVKGHLALMERSQSTESLPERLLVDENMEFLSNVFWDKKPEETEVAVAAEPPSVVV